MKFITEEILPMKEFDTPDKDNIDETTEEVVAEETDVADEIVDDIQEEETEDLYDGDDAAYEYDEEDSELEEASESDAVTAEPEEEVIEDNTYDAGLLDRFRQFVARKIYAFSLLDKKKRKNCIFLALAIFALAVLIFTDIIPILPNSYHRSYVGNKYTLGETKNSDAASYGKGVLYASNGSVMYFGPDMKLKSQIETFSGTSIVRTNGGGAVVYTQNGSNALVMSSEDKYQLVSSDEPIISASVNDDGDYILVTKEAGYTACVSAYSSSMQSLYKWHTGNNVIDTAISPDGTEIVASVIEYSDTDVYSKLVFLNTSSKSPVKEVKLDSNIVVELTFVDSGTVVACGDAFTAGYTPNGNPKWSIDYEGKLLKTFDISDDGNIAFLFNRYNSGLSESRIEIYNNRGKLVGEYDSDSNVRYISLNNDYCLLALEGETVLIDNDGDVKKSKQHDAEYSRLVLYENYNFAFGINDSIAEIVSVKH